MGKIMKCKSYKYSVKIAGFEPKNDDVNKGKKIWNNGGDGFYALEFFKMCLRFVYELSEKYGLDKKKRETKFKQSLNKLIQHGVDFNALLGDDEIIMNCSINAQNFPPPEQNNQPMEHYGQTPGVEMMMTLGSAKDFLKDTLKNDKDSRLGNSSKDVIGQVKAQFDNSDLTDQKVMELFSLGLNDEQTNLKLEEFQGLVAFRETLDDEYNKLFSGQVGYKDFKMNILKKIASQESIEQMEREGVTPMVDDDDDEMGDMLDGLGPIDKKKSDNEGAGFGKFLDGDFDDDGFQMPQAEKGFDDDDGFGNMLAQDDDDGGFGNMLDQDDDDGGGFGNMLDQEDDDFGPPQGNNMRGNLDDDGEDDGFGDFLGEINEKKANDFPEEDFDLGDIDEGVHNDNRREFGFGDIEDEEKNYLEEQNKRKEEERRRREIEEEEERRRREKEREEEEERRRREREREEEEERRRREREREEERRRREREEEDDEDRRQIELIKQKEREVLEEKARQKREHEKRELERKRRLEEEKARREAEEEEWGEEEEEENDADQSFETPQKSYQRYLDRLNPSESKFKKANKRGSVAVVDQDLNNFNLENAIPVHKEKEMYHAQPQEFSNSKQMKGIEFEDDGNKTPLEFYRHPLKMPGVNRMRESVPREYSEKEHTQMENLKRENIQLKKMNLTLKNSLDSKTIEKLYSDNEKLREKNAELQLKLKKSETKYDSLMKNIGSRGNNRLQNIEEEYKEKIEKMEKQSMKDKASIMKLENKIYEKDEKVRERDRKIQDLMDNKQPSQPQISPHFGNVPAFKQGPPSFKQPNNVPQNLDCELSNSKDREKIRELKGCINSLNEKIHQKDEEILTLEEASQKQRQIRLKLEKENNFLRVKNIQNKRDELEVEKLKAETRRLRNIAAEYKDQAEFYGATKKERNAKMSSARKERRAGATHRSTIDLNEIPQAKVDSGLSKMAKKLNNSLRTKPGKNFGRSSAINELMAGYLQNNAVNELKQLNIKGKGVLYEDEDLKIRVASQKKKLKSDNKIFYKMVLEFVNKDDFLTIKNLSLSFSGISDMRFMIKPNMNSISVFDLPPNSNFRLEVLTTPRSLPVSLIKLSFHYFMEGDTNIIRKGLELPIGLQSFIFPRTLSNMETLKKSNFSKTCETRLFQPDPSILSKAGDILKYYPEMEKIEENSTQRQKEYGGVYEFLVKENIIFLRFIWDSDTQLTKFVANCDPHDANIVQNLLNNLMDLFDIE